MLPKIYGETTRDDLIYLHNNIFINAVSILSKIRRGNNGLLTFALTWEQY